MMELELAKFEQKHGLTSEEVMEMCRKVQATGGSESEFIDALVASIEYETFVDLMRGMLEQTGHRGESDGFRRSQAGAEDEFAFGKQTCTTCRHECWPLQQRKR